MNMKIHRRKKMNNNYYKDEYNDTSANMRHYGTLRFARLTVFIVITGAMINYLFNPNVEIPLNSLQLKICALIISVMFWIVEVSDMFMWTRFIQRAAILEKQLKYEQYSRLPGSPGFNIMRPATIALWVFYLLVIIFWIWSIINPASVKI